MGDVTQFPGLTTVDISADEALEHLKGKMLRCVIVGEDEDGKFWFGGSFSDKPLILYLLEMARIELMTEENSPHD